MRSTQSKNMKILAKKCCPLKRTAECFDWEPIPMTSNELKITKEQMTDFGINENFQLYWCSECENVWYKSTSNYLHVIGRLESRGSLFVPSTDKFDSIYIGTR